MTVKEQAVAAEGQYVQLGLDEWRDQLALAVEPATNVGKRILADCRLGADGANADRVGLLKSDVLAVCDMAAAASHKTKPSPAA